MRVTLRHIRIFVAVCEEGSVTKAANRLYLAQPAVSTAIKELEEHYGVKLFDRISKRLYLTDIGRNVLEYATHIVSLFGDMQSNILQWNQSGTIKIGCSITVGTRLMPQYARMFAQLHPQAHIQVFVGSSEMIENKILQNDLDLGLIEGAVHSDSILTRPFMQDRLSVICSPDDPLCQMQAITAGDLAARPLLLREKGSGTRELFDHAMAALEYTCTPAWESTSTQALVNAAANGLGVAVLPYLLVQDQLGQGAVAELHIRDLDFHRGFRVIYHKNKFLTNLAKAFIGMCRHWDERHAPAHAATQA